MGWMPCRFSQAEGVVVSVFFAQPVYTSKLIGFKELAMLRAELKKRVFVFDLLVQF